MKYIKKNLKQIIILTLIIIFIFFRDIGRYSYLFNLRWLFVLVLSFLISYFFAPITIDIAYKYNILDIPNERKIHTTPTPRIGGVALFLAFIFSLIRNVQFTREILGVLLSSGLIFIISLLDDILDLPATLKIIFQIIATLIIILFGFKITAIPKGFPFENILEAMITIIWIVGVTNAVAFLDGIDGLVVGFGGFCSLIFLIISILSHQKFVSYLSAALLGGCIGVLPFNWHKAKLFLGDCGANLIGFVLASISIVGWWAEKNPIVSLSTPLLILSIPIFDMVYITISRIKTGNVKNLYEWLSYTGKDHIHHRLLNLGFSVPEAVGFILLVTFCLGLYSIIIRYTNFTDKIVAIILFQGSLVLIILSLIIEKGKKLK